MTAPSRTGIDLSAVHRSMPQGLAVVSAEGTFLEANDHVLRLLGRARDEVVGRSVLEFVHPDDLEFALDVVNEGRYFGGMVTGPVQVRYLDAEGRVRNTDLWSRTCLGVPGIDGYVVMMSEESTVEMLSDAVRAIARAAPLEVVLGSVERAMAGHPVQAPATFLVVRDGRTTPIGPWPLGSSISVGGREDGSPWQLALSGGEEVDVDVDDGCAPWLRETARAAGIAAIWCRPVVSRDRRPSAALVVWRRTPGRPSANQQRHLVDAVGIAALAFDQQAYRRAMERAAFVDPVSGLGNRARFEQLVGADGSEQVDGVLYVDLDRFKGVNDRYGHAAGDQILAHAGSRLKGAVRPHDEVMRVGGDEFVVLCRGATTSAGIEALAERIVRVLGEPYALDGGETAQVGASVGVVVGAFGRSLRERVGMADEAMYRAKEAGRNTWRGVDGAATPVG